MSPTNESCPTYEWVRPHLWMSHVSYEWAISHAWMSHVRATASRCLSQVTRVSYEWVMSHMNESCLIRTSNIRAIASRYLSHVTRAYASCLISWVMSHTHKRSMSNNEQEQAIMMSYIICHVTNIHASCRKSWVMSHTHKQSMSNERGWAITSRCLTQVARDPLNESCLIWMSHVSQERVISGP